MLQNKQVIKRQRTAVKKKENGFYMSRQDFVKRTILKSILATKINLQLNDKLKLRCTSTFEF